MASPCPPDKVQVCAAWHIGPLPPAAATPPTSPFSPECQLSPRARDSRKARSHYMHTHLEGFPTPSPDPSYLRPPKKPTQSWSLTANVSCSPDHPEWPTVFPSILLRTGLHTAGAQEGLGGCSESWLWLYPTQTLWPEHRYDTKSSPHHKHTFPCRQV